MGFADALGDAWDHIKAGTDNFAQAATAPIGAAFTAALGGTGTALNWAFTTQVPGTQAAGPALGAATQGAEWVPKAAASGALGGLERIGTGANAVTSYGISRPISTVFQQQSWNGLLTPDSWSQAWHNSRTLSPGQAIAVNVDQSLGVGPDVTQAKNHPFAPQNAPALQNYFQNTWGGKLSSGSIDFLLDLKADPFAIAGKAAKASTVPGLAIKSTDVEKSLDLAGRVPSPNIPTSLTPATSRQLKKSADVGKLVNRIVASSPDELQAMPELKAPNTSPLVQLFLKAKSDNPNDPKAAREAILDVLGTGWGDQHSYENLIDKRADLAMQMQVIASAPAPNVAALGSPQAQQAMLDAFEAARKQAQINIQRVIDQHTAVVGQFGQVVTDTGDAKVASTLPEALKAGQQSRAVNESWINGGLASIPIRVVSGSLAQRIPQHVNVQDANEGFQQLTQYLGAMKYTDPVIKREIAEDWIKAPDELSRVRVAERVRRRIVQDIGAQHGYNKAQLTDLLNAGEQRLAYTESGLRTRLYSAQDDNMPITLDDPDDNIIDSYHKPVLKSQMEHGVAVLDPRVVEREFKSQTAKTIMGGYNRYDLADVADAWLQRWGKLWKTTALARGAYSFRVQTDSQLRQMAHMETMAFLGTRWTAVKGVKTYLLSDVDKAGSSSFRNFFKQGDYQAALKETLTRDLGLGSQWNIQPDEMEAILSHILETNGGMADLASEITDTLVKKRRTGDFGITRPQDRKNWIPDYLRVVNRQAANSPSLQALLDSAGAVAPVAARVRSQAITGGDLWDEYRKVGKYHGTVEEYLNRVNGFIDHYLPHPDLQDAIAVNPTSGVPKVMDAHLVKRIFQSKGGAKPIAEPMDVHGEGYSLEHMAADSAAFEKVRNRFFEMAGSMPENVMARAPLFMYAYKKHLANALDNIPQNMLNAVGVENIRRNAMIQARKEMGRILYETSDQSNLAHSMRYLSPFFGAWEDTMKKWGSLMYDNPQYLERLRQMTQAPNAVGMVPGTGHALVVDDNGNRVDLHGNVFDAKGNRITDKNYESGSQYILLPRKLTSWTGANKLLGGGNLKLRKDSINSVFQGSPWWLPGFGPAVQVPVNHIVRQSFPKEVNDPIMKYVLPYGTTTDSAADQLLPKWVKTARNAFGNTQDFAQQQNIFLAEAVIANDHKPLNAKQLKAVDKKTRNYFIMKTATDNLSPVSVQPDAKYQFYIDMANQYKRDPTRADWLNDYMKDFPGYGEMSISLSANNTGIQATNSAFDASKKYAGDIKLNPSMGWMFVGPSNSGQFSKGVYDWQQTNAAGYGLNYRSKKDPQAAMDEFQTEQGWNQWSQFNTAVNLVLQQRGLHSTEQKGAEDLAKAKSAYAQYLTGQNPKWGQAYENADSGNATADLIQAASQFMIDHPETRTRPDMVALQNYIAIRTYIARQLIARPNSQITDTVDNGDLKALLDGAASQLAQNNIGFEQMYNRSLQFDKLTDATQWARLQVAGK